ncbi:hypothetical protein B0H21DRAFT_354405 [Amylocystis lapponica]|nr:hypothetical protein B0H21DRAFT_354405 [Amylocystis lapponica]
MQYSTWMLPDLPLAEQDLPTGGLRVDALVMCWLSCSSLTTLVLKHLRAPNVETVLFILRKCPALETLCLKFWGACAVDVRSLTSPRRPRITMRRLSSLQLSMPHKSVEQILGNLQFPATTRIRLHFDGPRNQAPLLNMLCPSLDPITSSISDATITMDDMYGYGVQLESAAGNFIVEWLCDGLIIPNRGAGLGRMAFSSLEFPSIRRLTIAAAPYDLATEDWVYLLDLTPNIDTLEITTPESLQEELFDALGNVGPSVPATDPQEPDVLCRNLKTLRIPNFPIHGSRDHLTLPVIEGCFRMRGEQGAFLSSFEIGLLLSPRLPRTFVNMVENDVATLKRIIWFELRNGRRMRRGGETLMGQ